MRLGTIVRIKKPKVEVEWWADGADNSGIPYWFPEECLEVVK